MASDGNASKTKQKGRKAITMETKIKILDRLAAGEKAAAIARHFNMSESTVRTIKQSEAQIRSAIQSSSSAMSKHSSYTRDPIMIKMEKALLIWVEDCAQKRILGLDIELIQEKSLEIYQHLKEQQPSGSSSAGTKNDIKGRP